MKIMLSIITRTNYCRWKGGESKANKSPPGFQQLILGHKLISQAAANLIFSENGNVKLE